MSLKFLRRASGRALLVGAMSLGMSATVVGAAASAASATTGTGNNWYVSTTGTNAGNNCSTKTNPCATINYALAEQAAEDVTGKVHVAAGTYQQQVAASRSNSGVTLVGAATGTTTIEPPSSGLASDTDTDGSYPQFYVIDVGPGTSNFKIKNITVNGLNAQSFYDSDGDGCGQDPVGIYYHEATGSITNTSITGVDLPADLFGCQGGQDVYVNSTSSDTANVTMTNLNITATAFVSATKADLPAATYNNDILPVKKEPVGWTGGTILVNGYAVTATPDGSKNLFITGTTPTDSPSGSTVNYNPLSAAYDKNGITCDDNWTTCSISGSTIQGLGPNNLVGQNGIQAFGAASVTLNGNVISGNTYTGGGDGNSASGILLLNNGPTTVENNTVSASDVGIYAGEVAAFGLVYSPAGTWTINHNTVAGATSDGASNQQDGYGEGIQLDSTTNNVQVTDNNVSGSAQSGILLTGVTGATIGGAGSDQGNTVTGIGTDAGIVVGGPGTECEYAYGNSCQPTEDNSEQYSSTSDTITDNSSSGSGIGVVVEGNYDPSIVGPSDPDAAYGNDFEGNVWSGNLVAGVADFSGYGASTPPSNSYGASYAGNSCTLSPGGAAGLAGYTGNSNYWSC
ncbi:MAG: right-handed parallel beta-helix repeat-containing protein [Acidimicrobiales bacterium]